MDKQVKTSVFYSINITLAPIYLPTYVHKIVSSLEKIEQNLVFLEEVKTTFFLDVFMMMRIEQKHPEQYAEIQKILHAIYKKGHDIGIYINMEWQNTEDLHQLDSDSVLDVFVHGRDEVFKIMRFNSGKVMKRAVSLKDKLNESDTPGLAVRVSNGKLQPFVHLADAYQFISAKLDASIPARLRSPSFYDYKKVAPGQVFRFSKDPAQTQRFGQFLSLPRCVYAATPLWCFRTDRKLKKQIKKNKENIRLFINEEAEMTFVPTRVRRQNQHFILSADMITKKRFAKTINKAKISQNGIISIESFLITISPLSFQNIEVLIESKFDFVKASDIIKKFGVSTNNVLLK